MKKIFALFMTILILTNSVGVTFASHYCGGKVVKSKITLSNLSLDCGMANMDVVCENKTDASTLKSKQCCQNHYSQLKVDDDFIKSSLEITKVEFISVFSVLFSISDFCSFNSPDEVLSLNFSPPLLNHDIPILIQSFLI